MLVECGRRSSCHHPVVIAAWHGDDTAYRLKPLSMVAIERVPCAAASSGAASARQGRKASRWGSQQLVRVARAARRCASRRTAHHRRSCWRQPSPSLARLTSRWESHTVGCPCARIIISPLRAHHVDGRSRKKLTAGRFRGWTLPASCRKCEPQQMNAGSVAILGAGVWSQPRDMMTSRDCDLSFLQHEYMRSFLSCAVDFHRQVIPGMPTGDPWGPLALMGSDIAPNPLPPPFCRASGPGIVAHTTPSVHK
jgi:hypothetical protein